MEIVAQRSDWTHIDEENLSKFLETETGKRFIPKLMESVPILLAGGDANAILIRSGEVRAYQMAFREILNLAHSSAPVQQESASAYPPLDDDAKWGDGQKLDPTYIQPATPPEKE